MARTCKNFQCYIWLSSHTSGSVCWSKHNFLGNKHRQKSATVASKILIWNTHYLPKCGRFRGLRYPNDPRFSTLDLSFVCNSDFTLATLLDTLCFFRALNTSWRRCGTLCPFCTLNTRHFDTLRLLCALHTRILWHTLPFMHLEYKDTVTNFSSLC